MTVRDLIQELNEYPQNYSVCIGPDRVEMDCEDIQVDQLACNIFLRELDGDGVPKTSGCIHQHQCMHYEG